MKRSLLIFILPFLLMGCGDADPAQLKERLIGGTQVERVIPVGIITIDSIGEIAHSSYPGYLEEGQSIDLAFKYGGTLSQLNVKEGSRVAKGQVLAQVSSPTLDNALRSAQATLDQAQDAYDRLKKVYDNGSLPEIKWKEMEANLEKAQSAYELANAMMQDNVVTAPFAGTVTFVDAHVGENIVPLKPVVRIISTGGMAVKISVPENEIAQLKVNDQADIIVPALDNRHYTGKVTEKSMTASLLTHSYPVKVTVSQPDEDLRPGMIGKVELQSKINKSIIIPANAVLINRGGKFVWVVENGCATRRPITLAGYSGKGVIVSEGLYQGDHVVVEGYQKISEGMKVSEN